AQNIEISQTRGDFVATKSASRLDTKIIMQEVLCLSLARVGSQCRIEDDGKRQSHDRKGEIEEVHSYAMVFTEEDINTQITF
ncbi:MAG: hypothetical protein G01um101433_1017, partial [Parcubacteria group bacterium Gr01-1014_33]